MSIQLLSLSNINNSNELLTNSTCSDSYSFYQDAVHSAIVNKQSEISILLDCSKGDKSLSYATKTLFNLTQEAELDVNLYVSEPVSYYDHFDIALPKPKPQIHYNSVEHSQPIMGFMTMAKAERAETPQILADAMYDLPDAFEVPVLEYYDLDKDLDNLDISFSRAVGQIIREHDWKDSDVYHNANITKSVFSNLRRDDYVPTKNTALAVAIGLKLDIVQTNELLKKAGYTLSDSNPTDVIVSFFIRHKKYNIMEINEALFSKNQKILGAK